MSDLFGNKYSLNFFDYKNKNNKDSSDVNKVESKEEKADTFRSRFASNMADYFKDNPDAFDFTQMAVLEIKLPSFQINSKVVLTKLQKDLVYSNLELIQ